ncbi:hypothetical protein [Rufibacter quisquiliarum]|uniref:Uncharacterized protein n=1 Tax=Rufibacter quisquiliarum TaxID=1549639 RepID=A0A839GWE2_9BACT|nr:hypothetical protein [Rufibacter quisquiliarum]MBA9078738.1 hypothetical protein [Rufibacter quisquiliarum]
MKDTFLSLAQAWVVPPFWGYFSENRAKTESYNLTNKQTRAPEKVC